MKPLPSRAALHHKVTADRTGYPTQNHGNFVMLLKFLLNKIYTSHLKECWSVIDELMLILTLPYLENF